MSVQEARISPYLKVDPARGRFQVSRKVFVSPEVFELEKQKILLKSWVFLGHESEVANPSDYIVRQVLDSNIIFTRDRDGDLHAFLNSCPHRGAQICRDERGNRKSFACPYHGWTFRNSGELQTQNAPSGYPADFNAEGDYNMYEVPRLATRSGFVYISFAAEGPTLDEHLADAGDRIDMLAQHSPKGLEVIVGCHEYYIQANYKLMCENSFDGYHLGPTHGSFLEYQRELLGDAMREEINGRGVSLGNGHACFEMDIFAGRPIGQWLPVWGEEARIEIEKNRADLMERVGEERGKIIAGVHRNTVIFPNTVMNDERTILVRSILPLAHDRMIVRAWAFAPVDEPAILRKIRIENALSFLGPGGFATPDDVELLESCQRGYAAGGIEWNDVSKGFTADENTERDARDWSDELQMRAYWVQYEKMMLA